MKRTSALFSIAIALMLSCGYASASPEPQHYTFATYDHSFTMSHESVPSAVLREMALIQWQHEVAENSRATRSDMHTSSGGLVFTVMQVEPDVDGSQPA